MLLPAVPRQSGRLAIVPRWLRPRAWPGLLLFILGGWPAGLGAAPLPGADSSFASGFVTRSAAIGETDGGEAPAQARTTDTSLVAKASQGESAGPSPRLIEFLDRRIHPHDWLHVSTTSSRHEVQVAKIGPGGLSGVRARDGGAVPAEIAWRDVVRLERRESRFRAGQVLGAIVGVVAGGFGGALVGGSSDRPEPIIAGGLVLGTAAGAWLGGAVGDQSKHWRPVYAVAPDPVLAPTTAKIEELRRLPAGSVLRVRGPFGEFSGRVTMIQASGLSGLSSAPWLDRGGALPSEPVAWSQVTSIERRGNRSGRFAVYGSVLVAGLAGAFAGGLTASGVGLSGGGDDAEVFAASAAGAGAGALIGAGLGALVGIPVPAWHRVYRAAVRRHDGD